MENLGITGYQPDQFIYDGDQNHISKIISNFEDHPSILKLNEVLNINESFHFFPANEQEISQKNQESYKKKASTFNGIPSKIPAENYDIISPFVTKIYNDSNTNLNFPDPLKQADITPTHKKGDTTNKENYRPVSILPSVSKIFERNMFDQISGYIDKYLSPY